MFELNLVYMVPGLADCNSEKQNKIKPYQHKEHLRGGIEEARRSGVNANIQWEVRKRKGHKEVWKLTTTLYGPREIKKGETNTVLS